MSIDFPVATTLGQFHNASNGVRYIWDGNKWEVYEDPTTVDPGWVRDGVNGVIFPQNSSDVVEIRDAAATPMITLDPNGTISCLKLDLPSFPPLPGTP